MNPETVKEGAKIAKEGAKLVAAAVLAVIGWILGKKKGHAEGHAEGVADGYDKASQVYEQKLLKQADEFLRERKRLAGSAAEKDELIRKLVDLLKHTQDGKRRLEIQALLSQVRSA